MAATLASLVEVRSQRITEAINFLGQMANALDATPWVRSSGERIRARDVAVEPFVLTKAERPRASRRDREGRERDALRERMSPMEEIEAARYELPTQGEDRERVRWRQVLRRSRARLSLNGPPGGGKTFITRHTLAELARSTAEKLERREVDIDDIELPLWVTARTIAQSSSSHIEAALLEALENDLKLRLLPVLREWLQKVISTSRVFIVVDALDELTPQDQAGFGEKSQQLDGLTGRVLVTCRTMHWKERKEWLGWDKVETVRLAPLERRQQTEIVRRFFTDQARRTSLERLLKVNFALRHTCTTPLLLTFACLLHEEAKPGSKPLVDENTTYVLLYNHMLRKMVAGQWRNVKPPWAGDEDLEDQCLQFLEGVGWRLFKATPDLNRFTRSQWRDAVSETLREWQHKGQEMPMSADPLRQHLQRTGLLVPAGFDKQRGDLCWSVVHRTFLEFLAAKALSRKEQKVWLTEAQQHFWFQPEWLEVLTFLAEFVNDATPLIEAVGKEPDDLFGSMLYLKARLAGTRGHIEDQVLKHVREEAFSFHLRIGSLEVLKDFASGILVAVSANAAMEETTINHLVSLTRDEQSEMRYHAPAALGRIGSERAIERLLELTHSLLELTHENDGWVCQAVVEALGEIGSERAIERLFELTHENDGYARHHAVEALGRTGSERAIECLLELTHSLLLELTYKNDEPTLARVQASFSAAMEALGRIGSERAIERLFESAHSLLDLTHEDHEHVFRFRMLGDWRVFEAFSAAVKALGEIGSERAIERLLELTYKEQHDYVKLLVEALGRIGSERAIERLFELTYEDDGYARSVAVTALGEIGSARAVERLLELTYENDAWARPAAVKALGRIGSERVIERLLQLTHENHEHMVSAAVEALGEIGSERAVERLLQLTPKNGSKYWYADDPADNLADDPADDPFDLSCFSFTDMEVRGEDLEVWGEDVVEKAVTALGRIGSERAIERLLELTHVKQHGYVTLAVTALGRIGSERAIERLLELTHSLLELTHSLLLKWTFENSQALSRARDSFSATVEALGKIGSERAIERLLELTRVKQHGYVTLAVMALGKIGSERAIERLLELTHENDYMYWSDYDIFDLSDFSFGHMDARGEAVKALWTISIKNKRRIHLH